MSEPTYGWAVLDPDGNVVQSGDGIMLQASAMAGDGDDDFAEER
jgi:hypothetical protein